jgi:1A family penicillin-binding protein
VSRALIKRRLARTTPLAERLRLALAGFGLSFVVGSTTLLAGGAGTAYAYVARDLPNPANLANLPLAQVTQIYDRTGQHLLYEFYEERRIAVPLSDVAPVMVDATLAIEDPSFYQHKGFDLRGMLRAGVVDVRTGAGVQGGSTITQQLVKRAFLTDERSWLRKVKELVLAVQVDSLYPKDQVLEMYLNQVYYGNQTYGVEAAALSYFGKHAKDLDLAEASILAGLVQAPSQYDPVQNPRAALRRQADVLDAMVRLHAITSDQAKDARREAAEFTYRQQRTDIVAPHFAFYVKDQLQQRVNPDVLRGGLKVVTTLDLDMQTQGQQIVAKRVRQLRGLIVNNGALVALDPKTGGILAMVGSADYYNQDIDGQVNVATAPRQPGSSFKPITYATAFATKKWSPATTVVDQPITRPDPSAKNGLYRPQNYDQKFHGTVTLRSALANSYNIPAVLVQEAVGTKEVIKTARAMGITTDLPEVMSLTLGAGVVRLLDMTSAYGAFANNGQRVEPTPFLKITDREDHVIYELSPKPEQVIAPEVAYMVADVLSDTAARRPAFGNVLDLSIPRTAAVKTGTANDYKDSWAIGFTPSLVVGAWVGNTDNSPMYQIAGSLGGGYIWKEFMDYALKDRPDEKFVTPPGVFRGRVCGVTDLYLNGSSPNCALGSGATVPGAATARTGQPPAPAAPTPKPTPVLPPR